MSTSKAITDFQLACQKHFICFSFGEFGLANFRKKLLDHSPNLESRLHVGTGHPNTGTWHASIKMGEAIESSQTNGKFTDMIAKAFIVVIYSEWDELYRHRLASEAEADPSLVKCDLMGDLRLIRHCIVHNKSILEHEHEKFKELKWQLSSGVLVVTREMFSSLIDQINQMVVRVDPA